MVKRQGQEKGQGSGGKGQVKTTRGPRIAKRSPGAAKSGGDGLFLAVKGFIKSFRGIHKEEDRVHYA